MAKWYGAASTGRLQGQMYLGLKLRFLDSLTCQKSKHWQVIVPSKAYLSVGYLLFLDAFQGSNKLRQEPWQLSLEQTQIMAHLINVCWIFLIKILFVCFNGSPWCPLASSDSWGGLPPPVTTLSFIGAAVTFKIPFLWLGMEVLFHATTYFSLLFFNILFIMYRTSGSFHAGDLQLAGGCSCHPSSPGWEESGHVFMWWAE